METEETVVIGDIASQGDDVTRVLRTGDRRVSHYLPGRPPSQYQEYKKP